MRPDGCDAGVATMDLAGLSLPPPNKGDVRSDNVCFWGSGVVFVDWAEAMRGNPDYDLACMLPTLQLEGGPRPFDVFPDGERMGCLAQRHKECEFSEITLIVLRK